MENFHLNAISSLTMTNVLEEKNKCVVSGFFCKLLEFREFSIEQEHGNEEDSRWQVVGVDSPNSLSLHNLFKPITEHLVSLHEALRAGDSDLLYVNVLSFCT